MKLSDRTPTQTKAPHILLWGDVGSGKTALTETLGSRLHLIDLDDGAGTGLSIKDSLLDARRSIDYETFIEPEPYKRATVFPRVREHVIKISNQITLGRWPYQALAMDSLSALADAALQQILHNSGKYGLQPEIQHWGMAFNSVLDVMNILRSMPIVVILTAHEQVKTIGSGQTKEDRLELAISGKNMASKISRYFDEIWYTRVMAAGANKLNYVVQTSSDVIPCRSRGGLPNFTNVSDGLPKMLEKIGYVFPPLKETKPT